MGNQEKYIKSESKSRQKLPTYRGLAIAKVAIVLVVDGNTEVEYFKKVNQLNIFPNLKFKPIIGNDSSYQNVFKENYDMAHKYLILDIDNSNNKNTTRANRIRSIIQSKDMKGLVYSNNYSFETFLLNHITLFSSPIVNKKEYDKFMKINFGVDSWANNKDEHNIAIVIGKITEESFKTMLFNIEKIYNKDCFQTPNSDMHRLFEKLEKIK